MRTASGVRPTHIFINVDQLYVTKWCVGRTLHLTQATLAEYKLTQSLPDNLKSSLPSIEEIEAEFSEETNNVGTMQTVTLQRHQSHTKLIQ
jgi:hypothetical protein